jgi:hypothetical protein
MIAKFFNLIGQVLLLGLVVLLSGALYVGSHFYVKSGEPMTVAEAQQRAPGITFRDFWASRVEQWRAWDDEQLAAGIPRRTCEPLGTGFTAWRTVIAVPFVAHARLVGQGSDEYYDNLLKSGNSYIPSKELLYDGPFLDAAWSAFELGSWWQFANHPGIPKKELNQRRACSTTYPTPADVSANRDDAAGTLP